MINNIIKADKEYSIFDGVRNITVAVSVGDDYVSLLHGLNGLKSKYGFSLTVPHYHHGIRGDEADRDLTFVSKLAESLGLPFVFEKGDAIGYSQKNSISLETAARELRYDFLERAAEDVIATAHTASDNIETVLFNMIRGTSLNGIRGIPPKRGNIIRPLILCDRECIEKYCEDNCLLYVTDSTNFIDDCTRNIIRHNIVPVLRHINSACVKNVSNLSVNLNEDNSFIETCVQPEFDKRLNDGKLDVSSFDKVYPSIAKRLIIKYYKQCFGVLPDMYHIERIYDVALGKLQKTSVSLNKSAVKNGSFLLFEEALKTDREFSIEKGIISFEEYKQLTNVNDLFSINAVDCDKIVGEVKMIPKNNADTIKVAGSKVTKTVKKLLTERKIPIEYRKNLPVFADEKGIVWIYNVGVADRVRITKSTKTVMFFNPQVL